MAEETGAEAVALVGALDEARNIGEDEARSSDTHHAELRVQGGKGIIGNLRFRCRNSGEQSRLAGIGKSEKTCIGDELQSQPQPALLAHLARIGTARRPVGRRLEMRITEAAIAAARQAQAIADFR